MSCVGIELCGKKNCLEQERCVFAPAHVTYIPNRKKKFKKQKKEKLRAPRCDMHIKFCINKRACDILGQCIQKHPLVVKDKMAARQLRSPSEMKVVVKIISRLMPSLKRLGQRKYYKPEYQKKHS